MGQYVAQIEDIDHTIAIQITAHKPTAAEYRQQIPVLGT